MTPRTILITGATDGLGRAIALRLATEGHRLLIHGRSEEKLAAVADEVAASGSERPVILLADLASLAQVTALADQVAAETDALDVLVNNAGIGFNEPDGGERRTLSADGIELRFAVNHLAAFALSLRLLPVLRAGAAPRIVDVASGGQTPIDWNDTMIERDYSGRRAYGQSKLAMITTAMTLADRVSDISVNSLHPGTYMPTNMVKLGGITPIDSIESGADATLRLIRDDALDGITGRFFDRKRDARASAEAYDPDYRERLWNLSVQLTDAPEP